MGFLNRLLTLTHKNMINEKTPTQEYTDNYVLLEVEDGGRHLKTGEGFFIEGLESIHPKLVSESGVSFMGTYSETVGCIMILQRRQDLAVCSVSKGPCGSCISSSSVHESPECVQCKFEKLKYRCCLKSVLKFKPSRVV